MCTHCTPPCAAAHTLHTFQGLLGFLSSLCSACVQAGQLLTQTHIHASDHACQFSASTVTECCLRLTQCVCALVCPVGGTSPGCGGTCAAAQAAAGHAAPQSQQQQQHGAHAPGALFVAGNRLHAASKDSTSRPNSFFCADEMSRALILSAAQVLPVCLGLIYMPCRCTCSNRAD
jgi:hypothetical protein